MYLSESRIQFLLARSYFQAAKSPDPSNQNGALLLNTNGEIVSEAFNTFPDGIKVTEEHLTDRDKKLFYVEHAERGTIYKAAKFCGPVEGFTMICPWFACDSCARAIILSGVRHVIGHKQRMAETPERWKANVNEALVMMKDCGVTMDFYDGEIGCQPIIVNGQPWQP